MFNEIDSKVTWMYLEIRNISRRLSAVIAIIIIKGQCKVDSVLSVLYTCNHLCSLLP